MSSSLTFSSWNWLWPVLVFGTVAALVLVWSYRASAGQPLRWVCFGLKTLGLAALALGSQGLIAGAVTIASAAGVSDSVIGITIVAAGTTMPELITCVVAALKREADIAVGNIVGSNIFNLLGVLGLAGVLAPISAAGVTHAEVWGAVLLATLSLPVMWRGMIVNRAEGAMLVAAYCAYLALVWRG